MAEDAMTESTELDPVIHAQARLRVVSALSILRTDDRSRSPGSRSRCG
jgi:hypothetical protein